MTIKAGEKMPAGAFGIMMESGPGSMTTETLFAGKKVVLFSVPGAFTPTCSLKHLPGFVDHVDEIHGRGVDTIACMAVNDVFVMHAWGAASGAAGKVLMLADGNGDYTRALGLELDATGTGECCRVVRAGDGQHREVDVVGQPRHPVPSAPQSRPRREVEE